MPKQFYTREEVRAILREAMQREPRQQIREDSFDAREELDNIIGEMSERRYHPGDRDPRRDFRSYRR